VRTDRKALWSGGRRRALVAATCALALPLAGCAQEGATVQGQHVHDLYVLIAILAAPVFLGVEGALLWCVVRYRKRGEDDDEPPQAAGNRRWLALFFAIPTVIVAFLFPFGERTLAAVQHQDPNPAVDIRVEAFQWQWTFYYLNEGFFETGKTLHKAALMELPIGQPVHIRLESKDVVHEFFVPEFLFMRNALPGRPNDFTFTPAKLGTFRAQCAEFCGLHHDTMTFTVKVVSQADYVDWVEHEKRAARDVNCEPGGPIQLVAKDNNWNANCLAVTKNTPFAVAVDNQDLGIEHNFAVYDSPARRRTIFQGPRFAGQAQQTFQLGPLAKGHLYFQCDVHGPAMSGPLLVK
jgi:cytochrome c oxidase subunit 2